MMKVAIMGTGGLGGYIGGRLAHAGVDVAFIARGRQLAALKANGLQVKHGQEMFHIQPVQATDNPADVGPVDLILLCVKAYDVAPAVEQMKPMIGPQTAIIPVLNGIDHVETMRQMVGARHVLGGQTGMTAHVIEPGVVERIGQHGALEFGEVEGGDSARCKPFEAVLGVEGVPAQAVPDIMANMWRKFAAICGFGVFSVVRGEASVLRRSPEAVDMILAGCGEGLAVAEAKGIQAAFSLDQLRAFIAGLPDGFKPSMLLDLEQGRRIEVEALNGSLSRLGREVGVPTPVNDFIYACLKPHVPGGQIHP